MYALKLLSESKMAVFKLKQALIKYRYIYKYIE